MYDVEDYLSPGMIQKVCACFCGYLTGEVVSSMENAAQHVALEHIIRSLSTLLACHGKSENYFLCFVLSLIVEERTQKSETGMTASFLKQDPNTPQLHQDKCNILIYHCLIDVALRKGLTPQICMFRKAILN